MVLTCFVISIPFVFSGIVVCLCLTRFPARVNRLYAADLVGAAAGCIGFVFLLNHIDGPSAVIVIGAIAGLGALIYARNAHSKAGTWCAVTAVIVLAGLGLGNAALHTDGHPALRIIWAKEAADPEHEYEAWNAFSRITVDPAVFGFNLPGGTGGAVQKSILIDSSAGTVLTRVERRPEQDEQPARLDHEPRGPHPAQGRRGRHRRWRRTRTSSPRSSSASTP